MRWRALNPRRRAFSAVALASATLVSACTLPYQQLSLPGPMTTGSVSKSSRPGVPLSDPAHPEARQAAVREGNDQFVNRRTDDPQQTLPAGRRGDGGDPVTLNFAGVSIQDISRAVLGEILGLNYVVSNSLKGTVTLQTPRPIPRRDVLSVFESVLKSEGAAIVVENGLYRVVPLAEAGSLPLRNVGSANRATAGSDIIQLRHVVPEDMQRLLSSVAPQAVKISADSNRNLLIVAGTGSDIASVRELVAVFDVDWMRGQSFGIYPVEAGDPETIAQELDTIFANDRSSPTKGMVRFIPNRRLKSILIVSSRAEYLRKAEGWLRRIDLVGQESEKQVHVYRVLHRPAVELAALLQRIYSQQHRNGLSGRAGLPPGTQSTTLGDGTPQGLDPRGATDPSQRPSNAQGAPAVPNVAQVPAPGTNQSLTGTGAAAALLDLQGAPQQPGANQARAIPDDRTSGIDVLADESNNSLVITATHGEFRRIRQILSRIDIAPAQVLLEATIAEVTLNDRLQFGLRWFFEKSNSRFTLTDAVSGAVAARVPGFSYFLNTPNVQVALNALSDVTDVNIVSSPSLMVLDNKRAQLQIGDEVPIATQSAVSVTAPGTPIVNSVAFRNTGVILNIVPQIGENGRILLDIEQEVSDVVPTTSSNIDSPTIQQRRIKTKVVVGSGQAIVLAGFMQDRAQRGRQQVPVLGNIPVLGNLFKDKNDQIKRTELLIAITPHIVKDAQQISNITAEFRDRMNFSTRPQRTGPPDKREQIERVLVR